MTLSTMHCRRSTEAALICCGQISGRCATAYQAQCHLIEQFGDIQKRLLVICVLDAFGFLEATSRRK